ncbi:YihY/virulence factor BrkB family protein [Apilactobacillus apisilvae]|uniref:YihY/virulence factor BrkB family protein n=1 Tax=Apilactobacillus apisilvae TaxID=2923364 RepID=A0ABY4PJF9_9LACO|nr:YihY/virulence factor BrkB family protein [Apilactobacillus apisilvae]UQS85576.1 YihY/virulence factor BrkB family protein [Apilactobacillus apisilvae]
MKSKKIINYLKKFILIVFNRYKISNAGDSAIVIAFYSLLSIFPLTIIAGNLLKLFNINQYEIVDYLAPLLPSTILNTLKPIIDSALTGASGDNFSIGLIITIWSASRALAAFQKSVNQAYGIQETSSIMTRIISFVWMLLLIVSLSIFLIFFGFGKVIINYSANFIGLSHLTTDIFIILRFPLTILGIFLLILVLYYFVPNVNTKWRYVWAGSLVVTIGMLLLSKGFSIYLHYFAKSMDAYKTLGTFVILMLWLYMLGTILVIGAVINASIQDSFDTKIKTRKPSIKSFIPKNDK